MPENLLQEIEIFLQNEDCMKYHWKEDLSFLDLKIQDREEMNDIDRFSAFLQSYFSSNSFNKALNNVIQGIFAKLRKKYQNSFDVLENQFYEFIKENETDDLNVEERKDTTRSVKERNKKKQKLESEDKLSEGTHEEDSEFQLNDVVKKSYFIIKRKFYSFYCSWI